MAQHASQDISTQNFDRYARLVGDTLNVPLAMVSIVEDDRLLLIGANGLPPQVEARRSALLSHSYCQYVVKDELPLVVGDARSDAGVPDDPVLGDLDVVAYAGFPLTDGNGHVVGALCAVDHAPRSWTDAELARLNDLAQLCSSEIVLHATHRTDDCGQQAGAGSSHPQLLLELSELLSDTLTKADVGSALGRAAARGLGCRHAGIWFQPDRNKPILHCVVDPLDEWNWAENHPRIPVVADNPVSGVYRSGVGVYLPDEGGHRALMVSGEIIGVLVLTWDTPNPFAAADRDTIAAIALYAAQAVHRANLLEEQMGAASTMQQALLSVLPEPHGLELGARYRTASANNRVGGDWYDATVLLTVG